MQSEPLDNKLVTSKGLSPAPKVLIGADSFRELIENSTVFVDKSLLIKEFLTDSNKVVLVTYPRRWGKTINMSMIKTFLEIEIDDHGAPLAHDARRNTALFASGKWLDGQKVPLNIWHEQEVVQEYFGRYPVIYISFKNVRGDNYKDIEEKVTQQIIKLYEQHAYLLNSNNLPGNHKARIMQYINGEVNIAILENCLKDLSEYLYKHFGKPAFILIDEYDTAINHANLKFKHQDEIDSTVELFRGILGNALKENDYIKKGLVTGILRIAKADLFSGVNNFQEYGILTEEYSKHYGFTQEEVDQLLLSYNVPSDLASDIKNWYNGYNFHGIEIYNPWSILKCLSAFQYRIVNSKKTDEQIKNDILQSYWEESGNIDFISDLLKAPPIKDRISNLMEGTPVYFDLKRQITIRDFNTLRKLTTLGSNYKIHDAAIDLLFSYLFLSGYLTMEENSKKFRLPNNEMRFEFSNKLLEYYKAVYNIGTEYLSEVTDRVQLLLDCTDSSKTDELMSNFIASIQELLVQFPDFEKITEDAINEKVRSGRQVVHAGENVIHGIMTYIILQVRTASILASEMYLGKGRADLVLIDNSNKKAAVIELKYNKTAREAIEQIKTMEYYASLREKLQVFLIGINIIPDKSVQVEYEVVDKNAK